MLEDLLCYKLPVDRDRLAFMQSLAEDLRILDHQVSVEEITDSHTSFEFIPNDLDNLSPDEIRKYYLTIRNRQLNEERDFILRREREGILSLLINGEDLEVEKIKPVIKICQSQSQRNVYRYFRHTQSVPTSGGVARRFYALVYDVGQKLESLMGIIGLTSTMYSMKDRDEYLGWHSIDSRSKEEVIRASGLRQIMQTSVCLALPPYNYIFGGKLIAGLTLSDPIQSEYKRRYTAKYPDDVLLAVFSTSAFGSHAAIFNRIELKKIKDTSDIKKLSKDGKPHYELFEHIGESSPYSTIMVSAQTQQLARAIASGISTDKINTVGIRSDLSKERAFGRALRLCGLDRRILRANRKGIYVGYLSEENIELLRPNPDPDIVPRLQLSVDSLTEYWKDRWLHKALTTRQDLLDNARQFKQWDAGLSTFLD
jgi:hypothetical protein